MSSLPVVVLYTKPKVHTIPCACKFVVFGLRVVQTVYIFLLRLPSRPFLGLVGEADSPPVISLYVYHGWDINTRLLYFTRYIPTPWIFSCFGFSAVSNLYIIPSTLLRFSFSGSFRWRLRSCQQTRCHLPCKILGLFCLISFGVPTLFWRLLYSDRLSGRIMTVSLSYLSSLFYQVFSEVLGRNAMQMRAISREVFSLTSCFFVSLWRRAQWDISPSLLQYFS